MVGTHAWPAILVALLMASCSAESTAPPSEASAEYLSYPERIDLVVVCVREKGFEATSYEGFGISIEAAGDAQLDAAGLAEGECWEDVEERFPAPPPLSEEEQYYYMLEVAECLRDLGHDVPDAPSIEAYVDQAFGDDPPDELWDPYSTLSRRGVDIWQLQREACPPYPWAR